MFCGGLPGLLAGLDAFCFSAFHWFGLLRHGVSVTFRLIVCCVPLLRLLWGRRACISKTQTTPCHAGWRMRD